MNAHTTRRAESIRERAFSLIEVLLAIFILGVGVISIAALFPAGIAQQRQSVDDMMGPIVADNAMAILRQKVRPKDFGYIYTVTHQTVQGDFGWCKPGFYFDPNPASCGIRVFAPSAAPDPPDTMSEIRWNTALYPTVAEVPDIRISQGERYYPMCPTDLGPDGAPNSGDEFFTDKRLETPQYVWDCMFRRFQGKIIVAIFVYRPTLSGGGAAPYNVPANLNSSSANVPPLPVNLVLTENQFAAWNPAHALMQTGAPNRPITGTRAGEIYNPDQVNQAWQEPRQWLLDYNNNIHRVVGNYREDDDIDNPVFIELMRPVPAVPNLTTTNLAPAPPGSSAPKRTPYYLPFGNYNLSVVNQLWYIPVTLGYDGDGDGQPDGEWLLTPVYATVKEL